MEHRQVWGYISDAAVDAPFENSLNKCHPISDALRMMREWYLPLYPAERHLLVAELERVEFMGDEKSEIVQFILRQFPERPSHPHALVIGRGCQDGGAVGVGVQRRDNNMASRGVDMPRQQQQPQQYWSRGGGMPQQQQQQQLQYWSRDGGIPHQHQRRSHAFPPARQTRQSQPLQLPSRRIHTSGGDGEHGRNPLSPPATEAVPDTSVFPAASSKAVAEAPTSSAGAASTASGTVPSATPLREAVGARESSAGAASSDAVSKAASTASGTVPSATSLREAVGARESSAGAASSDAVSKAAPATSGTVTSATPLRGAVGARESSAGAASSDAVSKAAPATSGTVTSTTPLRGAVGARESSSGAAPSDVAAEAFPLAVRHNNNSSNSNNNIISSSNSRGNGSSCSSNDTTSNHDSSWKATYVGALLRPFDPGKGCQRDARIGVILGLDLPFDRGKVRRRAQQGGLMVSSSFCLANVRENNWKNVCWKTALFSLFSTHAYHKGGREVFIVCLGYFFYVATFFLYGIRT